MSDGDRPITKAEFDHYMAQINAQLGDVVAKAVKQHAPASNPARGSGDAAAWSMVQALQAEIRERDRAQLEQMRDEIRELRNQPQADPLDEIENARALVAALGPEGDSQLMQGLGYLSNVAEAYIERSEKAAAAHPHTPPNNAQAVQEGDQRPAEPHHSAEHPVNGSPTAAHGGMVIIEDPH